MLIRTALDQPTVSLDSTERTILAVSRPDEQPHQLYGSLGRQHGRAPSAIQRERLADSSIVI
jgi:hypothetical protein